MLAGSPLSPIRYSIARDRKTPLAQVSTTPLLFLRASGPLLQMSSITCFLRSGFVPAASLARRMAPTTTATATSTSSTSSTAFSLSPSSPFSTSFDGERSEQRKHPGPLSGVRVLDLGQVVAGNFCGALLAYFGADVVKVEPPRGGGDPLRSLRVLDSTGTSLWWRSYGRNRRCVAADLRTEGGRLVARRLAERWADVVVENFRPGVAEGFGLGPKDLPSSLVYVRISGYGQSGPKAPLPGYASVCEAEGGFRAINGFPAPRSDGVDGGGGVGVDGGGAGALPPVRPNCSLGDNLAGLHAAFGAVLALRARDADPLRRGQVVDVALTESVFNMLEACIPESADAGVEREPSGSTISGVVPSATFETSDGRWCVVGGNGDSVYSRLMDAVGRPDMRADAGERYSTNAARCDAADEIYGAIGEWVRGRTLESVVSAMREARVPAGPILRPKDLLADEQFLSRGMFERASPPPPPASSSGRSSASSGDDAGSRDESDMTFTLPAIVPVLSRTSGKTLWAGPALGQHTDEVLVEEAGFTESEVEELKKSGAVA